jgi:phenylpropionate dioxygenase-like ring-hydroxylating dioxygenase large terminal subunit
MECSTLTGASFALEQIEAITAAQSGGLGTWFLREIWYFALASADLKRGKMLPKTILGETLLIGRDADGKVFAMQNICPHQALPLTDGYFDGHRVSCSFHGWAFNTDGVCDEIPALCDDQKVDLCKIKTKSYACRESRGAIWVYLGNDTENFPATPEAPALNDLLYEQTTVTLMLPQHIDYAALALIDPAHVPYVHNAWWWRSAKKLKEKTKHYVPEGDGWTMVKHRPSAHSIIFKLFGRFIETEISFRLPACRREYITFNGRTILSGITTLTPVDDTHTELNHTTYWTFPGTRFFTPIIRYFVTTFLAQDKTVAEKQAPNLARKPKLIPTIKDSGTPGAWYLLAKKEWADARREHRPYNNPIPDVILRWRS